MVKWRAKDVNLCLYPEDFTIWSPLDNPRPVITPNTDLAPDGTMTADRLEDSVTDNYPRVVQDIAIPNTVQSWTFSIYIKKDNDETRFPEIHFRTLGVPGGGAQINTKTGETVIRFGGNFTVSSEDSGDYWRFILVLFNINGDTLIRIQIFPALAKVFGGADLSALGSIVVWGAQLETGTVATTYGTSIVSAYKATLRFESTAIVYVDAGNETEARAKLEALTEAEIREATQWQYLFGALSNRTVIAIEGDPLPDRKS